MRACGVQLYLTELGSLALARTAELAAKTGAGAPATAPISAARSPMLLFRTAAVEGLVMSELGLGSAHLRAKQAAKAAAADAKEAAKAAADAAKRPAKVAPEPTKPLVRRRRHAVVRAWCVRRAHSGGCTSSDRQAKESRCQEGREGPQGWYDAVHTYTTHCRCPCSHANLSSSCVLSALLCAGVCCCCCVCMWPPAEKAEKKRLAARKLHIGEGNSKIMEALTSTPSAFPHGISPFFPDSGTAEGFYATLDDVLLEVTMADHSRAPKIAKGTRDFGPEQMQIRDKCFRTIRVRCVWARCQACPAC